MENEKDKDILLLQWQTCVEMANGVSARRDTMNNIFVTLNIALIAAISFYWNIKSLLMVIAGVLLCILWARLIKNYKMLNAEKFNIILTLEKQLPTQPFGDEWEHLKSNKKYRELTNLEKYLPIIFIVVYIITFAAIVINKLCLGE